MRLRDQFNFNLVLLRRHKVRTALLLLAISIGVASVILLTSLGEGARRYVDREFSQLGNRILVVLPGRKETTGGMPPIYGTVPRDLTLEDANALRRVPGVTAVAPIIAGTTPVSFSSRSREVVTLGTTRDFFAVRHLNVANGRSFTARGDTEALAECVIGIKLARELFGAEQALGQWLRAGDRRLRVVGVLEERGESLGLDLRDMILIPVRTAEQLFNSPGLFRVLLDLDSSASVIKTETLIREIIRQRHEGEDDITLISQDAMLAAFGNIITVLTLAIGAISAISLLVAGVLIMNTSLISVSQRRAEIGLLKALGGSEVQIRQLFLGESLLLAGLGSLCGIAFALLLIALARLLWPSFPLVPPVWAAPAAVFTAMMTGLLFSLLPSRRAARLDPVLAMRGNQ